MYCNSVNKQKNYRRFLNLEASLYIKLVGQKLEKTQGSLITIIIDHSGRPFHYKSHRKTTELTISKMSATYLRFRDLSSAEGLFFRF